MSPVQYECDGTLSSSSQKGGVFAIRGERVLSRLYFRKDDFWGCLIKFRLRTAPTGFGSILASCAIWLRVELDRWVSGALTPRTVMADVVQNTSGTPAHGSPSNSSTCQLIDNISSWIIRQTHRPRLLLDGRPNVCSQDPVTCVSRIM